MTVKLDGLTSVLLFALVGVVLWLLRQNAVAVVPVPEWAFASVEEEEDMPSWDDLT